MPTADDTATQAQLRTLAERYALGVDRHDVETFIALFHADAVITIHDPSETEEPRQIRGAERLAKVPGGDPRDSPRPSTCPRPDTYDIGDGEATGGLLLRAPLHATQTTGQTT